MKRKSALQLRSSGKAEAEKQKRAAERKRKAEQAAKLKALQDDLAAEEELLARRKAEQAAADIGSYIHGLLQRNFKIPSTARNGMVAIVRIRLLDSGRVVDVQLVKSSGNTAFDRAAEQAVWRTENFPKVADIARTSPAYFNSELREFNIEFKPEGLRW